MHWVVLDENAESTGIVNYTLRQLVRALDRMNHDVSLLFMGDLKVGEAIATIKRAKPDIIIATSINMSWMAIQLAELPQPKVLLWFDEILCRLVGLNLIDSMAVMTAKNKFLHMVGDRAWIKRLKPLFPQHAFHLLHLAADHLEFQPSDIRMSEDVVFIGSLQSPMGLNDEIARLEPIEKRFIEYAQEKIDRAVKDNTRIPNLNAIQQTALLEWKPGTMTIWQHWQAIRPPSLMRVFLIAWTLAKNAHRIRVLRQVLEVAPLRVCSEMQQKGHANVNEIRGLLGCYDKKRLAILDTSGIPPQCLQDVYHFGRIHIDVCDPQNEIDGLSYRIFQTAACARPLMLDATYGVWHEFTPEEMYPWRLYSLKDDVTRMMNKSDKELNSMGEAARRRSEQDHTWECRINRILGKLNIAPDPKEYRHETWNQVFGNSQCTKEFDTAANQSMVDLVELARKLQQPFDNEIRDKVEAQHLSKRWVRDDKLKLFTVPPEASPQGSPSQADPQ